MSENDIKELLGSPDAILDPISPHRLLSRVWECYECKAQFISEIPMPFPSGPCECGCIGYVRKTEATNGTL